MPEEVSAMQPNEDIRPTQPDEARMGFSPGHYRSGVPHKKWRLYPPSGAGGTGGGSHLIKIERRYAGKEIMKHQEAFRKTPPVG